MLQFLLIPCSFCLPLHYLHKRIRVSVRKHQIFGSQVGWLPTLSHSACIVTQKSTDNISICIWYRNEKEMHFNVTRVILVFSPEFVKIAHLMILWILNLHTENCCSIMSNSKMWDTTASGSTWCSREDWTPHRVNF